MRKFKEKRIQFEKTVLGHPLRAELTALDHGVHILLTGGERTHVGAVSICNEEGVQTLELRGHKESILSALWAGRLYQTWDIPVTVVCGIHYDNATKEELCLIVEAAGEMLEEVVTGENVLRFQNPKWFDGFPQLD